MLPKQTYCRVSNELLFALRPLSERKRPKLPAKNKYFVFVASGFVCTHSFMQLCTDSYVYPKMWTSVWASAPLQRFLIFDYVPAYSPSSLPYPGENLLRDSRHREARPNRDLLTNSPHTRFTRYCKFTCKFGKFTCGFYKFKSK